MHYAKTTRSIKGTNDWKKVDVSDEAGYLAYGDLLVGKGQITILNSK